MTKTTDVYGVREITDHMKATGLDFHAAHADLQATKGPANAPLFPCTGCGETICREPDSLCGACLCDPEED